MEPREGSYLEQLATWMWGPEHAAPPQRGPGRSQERERQAQLLLGPSPLSWLHGVQGAHGEKPPSWVRFLIWGGRGHEGARRAP